MSIRIVLADDHGITRQGLHSLLENEQNIEVIGEAEDLWEEVIRDFKKKNLAPIYRNDAFPNLKKLVIPRFDLTNSDKCIKALFDKTPAIPIFTTRGCPFNCHFCSVTKFFGGKYRTKPIDNVLKDDPRRTQLLQSCILERVTPHD